MSIARRGAGTDAGSRAALAQAFAPIARVAPQIAIAGFCIALVAGLWSALLLQLGADRERVIEAAHREHGNFARVLEEHVVRSMRAVDITLAQIESEYRRLGAKLDLGRYAREHNTSLDPYNALGIVDRNGNLIHADYPIDGRPNFKDRENFQFHVGHDAAHSFISKPRRATTGPNSGRWAVIISRRMNGPRGEFAGYVSVAMDPFYFSQLYRQADLGGDSAVALVGRDGVIRARQADTEQSAGQDVSDSEVFQSMRNSADSGHFIGRGQIVAAPRLYSFRGLRALPLIVVVGRSQAAVLARHEARKTGYFWSASGASAVILLFAALLFVQMRRRDRAQEALRAGEARLREAQQLAKLGSWELDLASGSLRWSDEIYRIFEIDPARFGASYEAFLDAIHPEDRERVNRAFTESVANRTSYAIVHRLCMADGRIKHVAERGQTFYAQDGKAQRSVGTVQDITALREAEDALRALNAGLETRVAARTVELRKVNEELVRSLDYVRNAQAQLVQSEKLAALGGLVAGVAHEINTPVGISVTAASHLQMKVAEFGREYRAGRLTAEEMERFLALAAETSDMVLANLKRAAELIRSFKQVAVDQSSGERRHFRLKTTLGEALVSLGPRLNRTRHQVRFDCPEDLDLYSYPGAFSQILANLVINSLVHGFEGIDAGYIDIQVRKEGDALILRYADNGRGIAAEHLPRLFEPFFTTKRGRGGSGLGLHIVYKLVTQTLGGTVRYTAAPALGFGIEIRLPQSAHEFAALGNASSSPGEPAARR